MSRAQRVLICIIFLAVVSLGAYFTQFAGETIPFVTHPNALIATSIAALGVVLMRFTNKTYHWGIAALIICLLVPITLVGFWPNSRWGISDWDYYFSYHSDLRRMIVEHHRIPQWNPYICGGTSAIGDPEFPVFTPTFLLELIFGVPVGLRLAIFFMTTWGGLGMLALGKRLKLSPEGSLLAALAFSFGSINLLEIVEGHPNVFSAFYLPWIFWSWLGAYSYQKTQISKTKFQTNPHSTNLKFEILPWVLLCGLFLALTFFQGGIYMLMYIGIAFLFLTLALKNHTRAFWVSLSSGLWALGFAAIKLIPALLWLRQFQDKIYASSTYLLPSLHKIFLGRYPHGSENIIPNQGGGWHEYGAYLGVICLTLALVSLTKLHHKTIRLLWLGIVITILVASSGPLLKPLFDQAAFLPRSNISRIIILAIVPLSLLAGISVRSLTPRHRFGFIIPTILVGLAALELTGYAAGLSRQAFILDPYPSVETPPSPIAYTINQHIVRVNGVDHSRAFAGSEAGYGTMSYCSVLGPTPAVRVVEDPEGSPYLVIPSEAGTATLSSWSPTTIIIGAVAFETTELILNANYSTGWNVTDVTDTTTTVTTAHESQGRLMTPLTPGNHLITFTYHAPGWLIGQLITFITTLAATVVLLLFLYNKVSQRRT